MLIFSPTCTVQDGGDDVFEQVPEDEGEKQVYNRIVLNTMSDNFQSVAHKVNIR